MTALRCPGCGGTATRDDEGVLRCDATGATMTPVTATQIAAQRRVRDALTAPAGAVAA
jgi:hypothetical protein